jgi:hypothetical protein
VLLEAVLKAHHHSRLQSERVLQQDNLLSLQMVYTHPQEQQAVLVMEIHQFLNCSPTSEQHPHQELVHQITPFYIQILELLKVLVRRLLETKQRFFTLHLEQHLLMEQVQKHLKKRVHSLELLHLLVMVLQHQKNCELSLELAPHQVNLARLYLSDTEKLELGLGLVEQPLTMKHSSFIPQSEPQAEMVMALQHPLRSRLLLEQQALQAKALMQHLVYTSHQEQQMAWALEIHQLL